MPIPPPASPEAWASLTGPQAGGPVAVLELGAEESWFLARSNATAAPTSVPLPLGTAQLARQHFGGRALPSPLQIEQAIAAVEDVAMPLRRLLPDGAQVFVLGADAAAVVQASKQNEPQAAQDTHFQLSTIEQLFGQWAALAEGRPLSQARFPVTAEFGAALLILREWMHHAGVQSFRAIAQPSTGCAGVSSSSW